jgi:glycosyltransferase involved in cell wall biosynthesis
MQPLLPAAVIAIPLRSGAGVRIKTIEALCAGTAVIATALGAEGLRLRDGHEFVRAETDSGFVDGITALLQDPARRTALGAQAQAWVSR